MVMLSMSTLCLWRAAVRDVSGTGVKPMGMRVAAFEVRPLPVVGGRFC